MNDPAIKEEMVLITSSFIAGVFADWRSYEGKQQAIKENFYPCKSQHMNMNIKWKETVESI